MAFSNDWICNRLGRQKKRCCLMSIKIVILWLIACSLIIFTITSDIHAEDNPSNSRELLVPVIEALKCVETPRTGRGSATLKRYDTTGYHEEYITFSFKDNMSRTDRFEYSDGKKGRRKFANAMGPKVYVGFNPNNAIVRKDPANGWYRILSKDFHPDTFLIREHRSFAERIQSIIEGPSVLSLDLSDSGIFKIRAVHSNNERKWDSEFWLDKEKGFRLVRYKRVQTRLGTGQKVTEDIQMSWKRYGQFWYINEAKCELGPTFYYIAGEEPQVKRPYRDMVEFVIEDFKPNVDVSESEFTLDGLNLREGIPVVDRISGVTFRYGSVPLTMADLEKPLAQAEFPTSITDRIDEDGNTTIVEEGVDGYTHDPNDSNNEHEKPGPFDGQIESGRKNLLLVTAIIVLGIMIMILAWKYIRFRK